MKTFRACFCCCLLEVAMLGLAGCATSQDNQTNEWSEDAKQWDDLTPVERAESILWEPFQYALLYGGYALGGH